MRQNSDRSQYFKQIKRQIRVWYQKVARHPRRSVAVGGVILAVFIAVAVFPRMFFGNSGYEDADTTMIEGTLTYRANCGGRQDCDEKQLPYDFAIMLFDKTGQQAGMLHPDDHGAFRGAFSPGDYYLVVSKTFEGMNGLPQRTVSLKEGKRLKLELAYGKETSR